MVIARMVAAWSLHGIFGSVPTAHCGGKNDDEKSKEEAERETGAKAGCLRKEFWVRCVHKFKGLLFFNSTDCQDFVRGLWVKIGIQLNL